jgi:glutathione S-transferase
VERGRTRLAEFYPAFDRRLGESEYVAGVSFSLADITALCIVDFARAIKLPWPEGLEHFDRWHALVSARPSAAA